MAVKYVLVMKIIISIAVLEQACREQQFWCANHTKNPSLDRQIKYLDFASGHLASTETE